MGDRRRLGWIEDLKAKAVDDYVLRERLSNDLFPQRAPRHRSSTLITGAAVACAASLVLVTVVWPSGGNDRPDAIANIETSPQPAPSQEALKDLMGNRPPLPPRKRPPIGARPFDDSSPLPKLPVNRPIEAEPTPAPTSEETRPEPQPSASEATPRESTDPTPVKAPTGTTPTAPQETTGTPRPTSTSSLVPAELPTLEFEVVGERSWIEVRDGDGEVLLRGRLRKGDSRKFFDDEVEVFIAHTPSMRVIVNGVERPDDGEAPHSDYFKVKRSDKKSPTPSPSGGPPGTEKPRSPRA